MTNSSVKTLSLQEALDRLTLPALDRNLFSSPAWLQVLQKTYSVRLFVKYIEANGAVSSYIVYSVVKNFLEWKICVCSYCDYCDGHVQTKEDWQAFIEDLRREYPDYRIAVRNLRDEIVRECAPLKVLNKERFHLLDVRAPEETLWKQAHDSFKAAVNQGKRMGVRVEVCPVSELKKFFELHLLVRKYKYRVFPQPYIFFKNIWDAFIEKGQGILLGAYDPQGRFIGGNIFLICGNTLYYKFNTSSKEGLKFRPNNILIWEGICFAKKKGLEFVDLGSSGCEQTGLIRFKEHTGAEGMDITHLGYHPPHINSARSGS